MELTKEQIEDLKILLQEPVHTNNFRRYEKYHQLITGKVNQSSCNKCAMRKMVRFLKNYIKNLN